MLHVWGPNDFRDDPVEQQGIVPTLRARYGLQPGSAGIWASVGHEDIARNDAALGPSQHDYVETVTFVDGFDRVIQTKKDIERDDGTQTAVGMAVSGQLTFDNRGRLAKQGQPVFSQSPPTDLVNVGVAFPPLASPPAAAPPAGAPARPAAPALPTVPTPPFAPS